jgi:hypothetical protein
MSVDSALADAQTQPSPSAVVQQLLGGALATNLLYVMTELGLADLLADRPRTSAQLAALTDTSVDILHRVLRGLTALGAIQLQADGRYALTPVGACLRSGVDGSLQPLARLVGLPAMQHAWSSLLDTVQTGRPAFELALGIDFGRWLAEDREGAARFHAMMGDATDRVAAGVVTAYDFSQASTIVDVGGSTGSLLRAVLRANPYLRGTIFDRPHAVEQALHCITADGLSGRCTFEAGDFFEAVPVGADVYLLKSVIHDWDDGRALAILASCRRAMHATSRLLVIESLLGTEHAPSVDEVMGDLIMLVMATGRERTTTEYGALLDEAGLRLRRTIPTGLGPGILEVTL